MLRWLPAPLLIALSFVLLIAAVVVCGRVVWADATGVLQVGSRRRATDDSLFVLNSAAKTYVAAMVNYRYIANAVWTTEETVKRMKAAAAP